VVAPFYALFCRPLRGLCGWGNCFPRAYARGYRLPPFGLQRNRPRRRPRRRPASWRTSSSSFSAAPCGGSPVGGNCSPRAYARGYRLPPFGLRRRARKRRLAAASRRRAKAAMATARLLQAGLPTEQVCLAGIRIARPVPSLHAKQIPRPWLHRPMA